MGIYKKTSGLLFDDGFEYESLHARYTLSPHHAGDLDHSLKQFVMNHTEEDNMLLFDIPESEHSLLFEVTADYVPTEHKDEGGIVVWKDGESRIEFLESIDTAVREYSKWRALRTGNRWTFYADRGSGWELFDTDTLAANKLGVVLKSKDSSGFVPLKLDRLVLCKSDKITVGNLSEGCTVYLCDEFGNSIASSTVERTWTGVDIQIPTAPYYGMIKVYDSNGTLLSSLSAFDIYGGDTFLFGTELQVHWQGKELNVTQDTYLGTMYDNMTVVQMELVNPSANKTAKNVKLGILQYLDKFGYEWVDLCHDDEDQPAMDFSPTLELPEVSPLGRIKFWMKVERKNEHFDIKPLNFILDINHV